MENEGEKKNCINPSSDSKQRYNWIDEPLKSAHHSNKIVQHLIDRIIKTLFQFKTLEVLKAYIGLDYHLSCHTHIHTYIGIQMPILINAQVLLQELLC